MKTSNRVHTPVGTARFVSVFTPRSYDTADSEKDVYELVIIFDEGEELEKLKNVIREVGIGKFGAGYDNLVKRGTLRTPIRENLDKLDKEGMPVLGFEHEGYYIRLKSKEKPGIVDANAEPIMDKKEVYDGCRVRASVRVFPYDNSGKGVSLTLVNLQKVEDGKRLAGDLPPEEDFGVYVKGNSRPSRPSYESARKAPVRPKRPVRQETYDDEDDLY